MHFDHSYAKQLADLSSPVKVTPLVQASLALFNSKLAEQIQFPAELSQEQRLLEALFTPQGVLNQHPIAQKYGGHQFGGWNPDLGDGRGLLLAEINGKDNVSWDLHLKGAGKTPYSRFGDGRAVLRSSIREYLASEALHGLGIPTSRALCLIASNEPVYREKQEHGAMLIRACQSHIRFGHFEYFYHTKQHDKLHALFQYTLEKHFPECQATDNPHLALLENIVTSTAKLIAKWQAFGFCHGVMNTDNMSIHGITFDFGPYAFLDRYQADYICNHSDHAGRYAYDQQPGVALWNLNALAHAFTPHLSVEHIKLALGQYEVVLRDQYAHLMCQKMGFVQSQESDMLLVNDWLTMLEQNQRDYTLSFRLLSEPELNETRFADHFIDRSQAKAWYRRYQERVQLDSRSVQARCESMNAINPKYVLRNYLAQVAIDKAEQGDFSECERLLEILATPFAEHSRYQDYAKAPPEWGQSMEISCSS
ncbi:protein adenylyltransferase SelO [Aliiglaciecola litoralis]|uniref:Protein nucleotidyltransferase YdiU n=1 Tax=Aliiglaciecola litoralis TaxID=582857 RepID=A0ABN1LI67_9ALTE